MTTATIADVPQARPRRKRTRRTPKPLRALIETVLERAAADLNEEEAVHDLRVACRRLESGTRLNQGILPRKRLRATRAAARAIRRAFDQARDLEVIAAEIASVPGLSAAFLDGVREAAHAQAAAEQARGKIKDELETLEKTRDRLTEDDVPDREMLSAILREHLLVFFNQLERLLPESTDEALHEVRIAAKRLRYEMEIARPAFPRLPAAVKRLKRVQDILGRHQDAAVGLRWAEALTPGDLSATVADRAALMRYYAALARNQRRQLRRLLDGWRQRSIRDRFLAAV
jgi:CHAD domain-containing protein